MSGRPQKNLPKFLQKNFGKVFQSLIDKGCLKKPNREQLHSETSDFLHNVKPKCVCNTQFMDFFCHLFFYTKIEKYCFFPINFKPVRKSAQFFFFKKMVFFSTEKVQTLDLTLQIQRLKPLSHRGHFLHQFYL